MALPTPAAEPTRPLATVPPPATASSVSIRVMHYHRVGHCVGELVASRDGMTFVPESKASRDGFEFKYNEFVHVMDDATLTIKSSTRTYRFKAFVDKRRNDPSLDEFETRLSRWR